jgi:predicted Fe-S protein YdhL (DUF1289 family)
MISPCVRLCTLDPETGICVGCGRTLAEIGKWSRYTDPERREIMDALPERLARQKRASGR